MITIRNIEKSFGKNRVLKGIDLNLDHPGITAILGPNGSGKTTLIKSILGMVNPDSGDIYFDGHSIKNKWSYRDRIDYLPQIARFPENLKVKELIAMILDLRGRSARDKELIRHFSLEPFLDQRVGKLSGGTRQKVNLVLGFMFDNPVIILDEPTSGLDPIAMIRLKELILEEKARGKIILITTHIMQFVEEMAERVLFILDGEVYYDGTLSKLKEKYGETDLERTIARILMKEKPRNGHASKQLRSSVHHSSTIQ